MTHLLRSRSTGNPSRGAVVITGASSGIGKATALYLDSLGFRVFAGVRREDDGESLRNESSGRIRPVFMDVTDTSSIASAAELVSRETGEAGLAGLVNNAGIVVAGPIEFLSIEEFREQLEVNVTGQVAVTQAFIPQIRKARGRIVFIGSISGRVSYPFMAAYSASKFALEALADALRVELMPWGIPVSIIEPGSIATPIWEKSIAAAEDRARGFPQRAFDLYGTVFDGVRRAAKKSAQQGISPLHVARAVAHALTSKRPRTRYLVGTDARLRAVMRALLPDRIRDRFVALYLGLRRNQGGTR